jgi:hypothetical protein
VAVAREIAQRDEAIRTIVTGRIEKFGALYSLSARIVRAVDGVTLAGFSEEVAGETELLRAIRRQALAVREALGESVASIEASRQRYEKVTTPSLRALQLYSEAAALMSGDQQPWDNAGAERLLREAIRIDPSFASARILLAWALRNQDRDSRECLEQAAAAAALADSTTDAERHFIMGSVHSLRAYAAASSEGVQAELTRAATEYEAVLALKPDHRWALVDARVAYSRLRRPAEIGRMLERLADERPNSFIANGTAAETFMLAGDAVLAARYGERAAAAMTPADRQAYPERYVWLQLLPARKAWLAGDLRGAQGHLDAIVAALPELSTVERFAVASMAVPLYMSLGQMRHAEALLPLIEQGPDRTFAIVTKGRFLLRRGDRATLRRLLSSQPPNTEAAIPVGPLWVEAGLLREAHKALAYMETAQPPVATAWLGLVRAHLAVAEHRYGDAIVEGQRALDHNTGPPFNTQMVSCAAAMAEAWRASGDTSRAIQLLETYTSKPRETFADGRGGPTWLAARLKLAALYRDVGREREARAAEEDVRRWLALADADFPLLHELAGGRPALSASR